MPFYEDNMSTINMINNLVPTERSRHIDIQHFAIQDWAKAKDIVMRHIPGILCIPDGLTKALGWVLHSHHARCMMGHFLNSIAVAPILLIQLLIGNFLPPAPSLFLFVLQLTISIL